MWIWKHLNQSGNKWDKRRKILSLFVHIKHLGLDTTVTTDFLGMFVTVDAKGGKKNKAAYVLWKPELLGHSICLEATVKWSIGRQWDKQRYTVCGSQWNWDCSILTTFINTKVK